MITDRRKLLMIWKRFFDSLNGQQMEKVCEFLSHMRDEEEIEKALCQKVWLRDTLVFLMKNYAERTCSRLEIREKDTDFLCGPAK